MRKILIANRGEIAVRVARACRDAGLASVAVYAEPDREALHVRAADEAYALDGRGAAETYLAIGKILAVACQSGADAVHPGYGFLAENAEFAEAVTAAGLTWIGPPPAAIRALGDKVQARRVALEAGAPLVAGTPQPVSGAAEAVAFARQHGLPVAIKAAFGGGGRGLKVVRELSDVDELYESAVREAVAAFGRGECYVERYLDRARHVETQCLADAHGNVVVVSTRDCSVQRRHQKLVEEAPALFLTGEQLQVLYSASKAILRAAGYVGAGTCEFLVGHDGTISFLEVNTRLQVEHPVTEEVTGIDLVREMFRIAAGEPIGYDDPVPRGHAIEFRVNAEDPGRGFLPAAGTLTRWEPPSGPGVRLDAGYSQGQAVPREFDSLIAKLIVTGADRRQAIERARRALDEFVVTGIATALPFHRSMVRDRAFAPDGASPPSVHTRWVETGFDNQIPAYDGPVLSEEPAARERVIVEVEGKRVHLVLPVLNWPAPSVVSAARPASPRRGGPAGGRSGRRAPSGDALIIPMQGTIVKLAVQDGAFVAAGDTVAILEAMKMEQPVTAHKAGTVSGLAAVAGETVSAGSVICDIKDRDQPIEVS